MSRILRSQGIYRTSQPVISQPATTFPGPRVTSVAVRTRTEYGRRYPLPGWAQDNVGESSYPYSNGNLPASPSTITLEGNGGTQEQLAQSFIAPVSGTLTSVTFAGANNGATDDLIAAIQADVAGVPSGTDLSLATVSRLTSAIPAQRTVGLSAPLVAGTRYWIVWRRSGARDAVNDWGIAAGADIGSPNFRGIRNSGTWTAAAQPGSSGFWLSLAIKPTLTTQSIVAQTFGVNGLLFGTVGGTDAVAQSYRNIRGRVTSVIFYVSKTGSPADNLVASIYADSGGTPPKPTGPSLADSNPVSGASLPAANIPTTFTFPNPIEVTGPVWIGVSRDGAPSNTNAYNIQQSSASQPDLAEGPGADRSAGVWGVDVSESSTVFFTPFLAGQTLRRPFLGVRPPLVSLPLPPLPPPIAWSVIPAEKNRTERSSRRATHSQLFGFIPTMTGFVAEPVSVTLTRTRPRRTLWMGSSPVLQTQPAFSGPAVKPIRIRPRPTYPRLPQVIVPPSTQVFYGPAVYCVSPDRLAHRYRRWQPIPGLGPPQTLQTFSGPSAHLTRIRPRPTVALVSQLTLQTQPGFAGPDVTIARVRPRIVRSRLPQVIVTAAVQAFYGPNVTCVSPDRLAHRYHRQQPIPGLAPPVTLQVFQAAKPTLTRIRPRKPTSFLKPPATLEPEAIQDVERKVRTPFVRTRPRKTRAALGAPTTLQTFSGPTVTETKTRPRHTAHTLAPPTVIRTPSVEQLEQTIRVTVIRTRPRPTTRTLSRPTVLQTFSTFGPVVTRVRPRHVRSLLASPAVVAAAAPTETTVSVTVVRARPRPTSTSLAAPTALQVFSTFGPWITRIRPRDTAVRVFPPTVVRVPSVEQAEDTIKVSLVRTRPRPTTRTLSKPTALQVFSGPAVKTVRTRPRHTVTRLAPPTVVRTPSVEQREQTVSVTQVRTRPRATVKTLGEPTVLQTFGTFGPALTRTRPRPTVSVLSPPTVIRVPSVEQQEDTIKVTVVRIRPRPFRADLLPPTVLRVFSGPTVQLTRIKPQPTNARVSPPTVVRVPSVEQAEQTVQVHLTRIRPRPTRPFLRPPAVISQAAAARETTVQVHTVRTRPRPTTTLLQPPATLQPYSVTLAEDTIHVRLVQTRPRPTRLRLRPPTTLQVFSGPEVFQTRIRPRLTTTLLSPPATLEPYSVQVTERAVRTAIVRTRPRPTRVRLAAPTTLQVFTGPDVFVTRIRPRPTQAAVEPPATLQPYAVTLAEDTIRVILARTRPRPTTAITISPAASRIPAVEQQLRTIQTHLTRVRPRPTRRFIQPPTVINAFAFYASAPHTVRIRPAQTRSLLRPPTVVISVRLTVAVRTAIVRTRPRPTRVFLSAPTALSVFAGPTSALTRTRPRKIHSFLSPPSVTETPAVEQAERTIRVVLTRIRPRPKRVILQPPTIIGPLPPPVVTTILEKLQTIPDRLRRRLYRPRLPVIIQPPRPTEPTGVTEGYDYPGAVTTGDDSGATEAGSSVQPETVTGGYDTGPGTEGYDAPATGTSGKDAPL